MTGKKYFYAIGQRARSQGFTKSEGMAFYRIDAGSDYARIAFDAGYRGL